MMSNRLSSKGVLGYVGTDARNPLNVFYRKRDPLESDTALYTIGDMWINTITKQGWILVSLAGTLASRGILIATWLRITNKFIGFIQGNNDEKVGPDSLQNINLMGDGASLDITGTVGTHTLEMSSIASPMIKTFEGNSGGPVSQNSSHTLYLVGDGTTISFNGNPGTNTLEAVLLNPLPFTLTGNNSDPVPLSGTGKIYIKGDTTSIDVTGNPGTHTLTMSYIPSSIDQTLMGDTGGLITPTGGTIFVSGGIGFDVTGSLATNTLTITGADELADTYDADIGDATPFNNILEIGGATNIETTGSGNTISLATDSAITGLIEVETDALIATTAATIDFGNEGVVQSDNSGSLFASEGTDGQVLISSSAGAPIWSNITEGSNITIINGPNSMSVARSGSGLSGFDFIGTTSSGSPTLAIPSGYKSLAIKMNWMRQTVSAGTIVQVPITLSDNGGSSFYTSNYIAGIVAPTYKNTFPLASTSTTALLGGILFGGGSNNQAYLSFLLYIYGIDGTSGTIMSSGTGTTFTFGGLTPYFMRVSGVYYGGTTGPINAIQCSYSTQVYGLTY